MARTIRCSYCYDRGHARHHCPAAKLAAQNGDALAKRIIERGLSSARRCSYCRLEGHNSSNCQEKFDNTKKSYACRWTTYNALVSVIKEFKIAKGTFIQGPLCQKYDLVPTERNGRKNYEIVNYVIGGFNGGTSLEDRSMEYEHSACFYVETIAEPSEFKCFYNSISLPFLRKKVLEMPDSLGKEEFLKVNRWTSYDYNNQTYAEKIYKDNFQVLIPAEDDEVEKLLESLKQERPLILDYDEVKPYNAARRKLAKEKIANSGEQSAENADGYF